MKIGLLQILATLTCFGVGSMMFVCGKFNLGSFRSLLSSDTHSEEDAERNENRALIFIGGVFILFALGFLFRPEATLEVFVWVLAIVFTSVLVNFVFPRKPEEVGSD